MDGALLLALTNLSQISSSQPQLLSTVTLAATSASVTYTVITPYPRILACWGGSCSGTGAQAVELTFNGDSASHYVQTQNENATATVSGATTNPTASIKVGNMPGTGATANYWASGSFLIEGANQSSHFPTIDGTGTAFQSGTSAWVGAYGGMYLEATPITTVTLQPATGSFAAGSAFSFYGLT